MRAAPLLCGFLALAPSGCLFDPGPLQARQCASDADCPAGQLCLEGFCGSTSQPDPQPDPRPDPPPDLPDAGIDTPDVDTPDPPDMGSPPEDEPVEPPCPDPMTWYRDLDGDNHGDPAQSVVACEPPAGHVALGDDCDDTHSQVLPGAQEACDGLDNDCSGAADDSTALCPPGAACQDGGCRAGPGGECDARGGCTQGHVCFQNRCVQSPREQRVTGQWDFNGDLGATIGHDLAYFTGRRTRDRTAFGTTSSFGLPDMPDGPAEVMQVAADFGTGYVMEHDIGPTGRGWRTNHYTLIMDVLFQAESSGQYRGLWQTDPNNFSDADFFIGPNEGIGIRGRYEGQVPSGTWVRIALVVDLTAVGGRDYLFKYINGVFVGSQRGEPIDGGLDGRFSLSGEALLFADISARLSPGFVASVQIRNYPMNSGEIAELGGPTASGIR